MAGDKYYKAERAKQAQFKKSEEAMNKKYKQVTDDETVFEYLNKIRPEDSTREYNEVEHYKKGGKIKIKKAFMGLAVEALKGGKGLGPLIGMGADKLLKRSQTARDVSGKLGVGGKLISNYYNDKASNKRNAEAPKEEVTFDRLQNGGSVMVKTKLGKNKATKLY
jgi:hypothetical protein